MLENIKDKLSGLIGKLSKTWQFTKGLFSDLYYMFITKTRPKIKSFIKRIKKLSFDIQVFLKGNYLYYKKRLTTYILEMKKIWLMKKLDKTADKIADVLEKQAKLSDSNIIDIASVVPNASNIEIE